MTYFKVDDKLHSHRKTMRASVPAMGLWVLAASWCMDQRTDGWVPDYAALRMDPEAEQHAAELVRAGYWHESERDGERGWTFHEWEEWQYTAAYLDERRRRNANRMRRARAQEQAADQQEQTVRAHNEDTTPTVHRRTTTTTTTTKNTAGADAPETFPAFWSKYPRKVGKAAAAKAYAKALRSTDADTILAGLTAAIAGWSACGTEARFIPHPSTWLNEGRWEDQEQLPVAQQGVTRVSGPTRTAAQCSNAEPHARHAWEDSRNAFMCLGVAA